MVVPRSCVTRQPSSVLGLPMLLPLSLLILIALPAASAYPQTWVPTVPPMSVPRFGGSRFGGPDTAQLMQRWIQRLQRPPLGTSNTRYKDNARTSQRPRVPFPDMRTTPNKRNGMRSQYNFISEGSDPREVELWFNSLPVDDEIATKAEATALKEFLTGKTTVVEAGRDLTSAGATPKSEGDLARLWGFINDVALALPAQQDKLIELLETIKILPGAGAVDWSQLPGFAEDIRDRWDFPEKNPLRPEYIKLNAWAAIITKSGVVDLKHMAIWSFREALEKLPRPKVEHDPLIVGAAQWMIQAATLVRNAKGVDGPEGRAGPLFDGEPGFSDKRWRFWKIGFQSVQTAKEFREETKAFAKTAVESMNYAE